MRYHPYAAPPLPCHRSIGLTPYDKLRQLPKITGIPFMIYYIIRRIPTVPTYVDYALVNLGFHVSSVLE